MRWQSFCVLIDTAAICDPMVRLAYRREHGTPGRITTAECVCAIDSPHTAIYRQTWGSHWQASIRPRRDVHIRPPGCTSCRGPMGSRSCAATARYARSHRSRHCCTWMPLMGRHWHAPAGLCGGNHEGQRERINQCSLIRIASVIYLDFPI